MAKRGVRISLQLWRESELPFLQKCKVALTNELRKATRLKPCCGHPGEPGC